MTNDDLAQARARVRAQLDASRARNAAVNTLAASVASITATARSARGEVTVTARPDGTITDVVLAPGALDGRADALGRLVTATIAEAQRTAAQLALEAAADTLGSDSAFVAGLRAEIDERHEPRQGEM